MKYTFLFAAILFTLSVSAQQKAQTAAKARVSALPAQLYTGIKDSCTSIDITFFTSTASISLDARNVHFFANFVSPYPVAKDLNIKQDGFIMWGRNGKEYLTGNLYFSGDSSGYLVFNKNDKEYVNALSPQGAGFLMTHGKKK